MTMPPRLTPARTFWTGVVMLAVGFVVNVWLQFRSPFDGQVTLRFFIVLSQVLQIGIVLGAALVAASLVLRHVADPEKRAQADPVEWVDEAERR